MKKLTRIAKTLAVALLMVGITGGIFAASQQVQAANYPITGQNYFLAGAGVTSSQTTVPLTSFKTPAGIPITMTMIGDKGYGTLEPQSPTKTEIITFTGITQNGNGTATLTGVTRGIDFVYPYAASTTIRQAHSGGSTMIISNTPNWYYDNFPIQGDDNITVWPAASSSVASRGYVDYVAFNGAGVINASTVAKGVTQIATAAQAAASLTTGSSGAISVLPSGIATSTWNPATAGNVIPVTSLSTGKIDNNFIATSSLLAATSTINIGAFPAWQIGKQFQIFTGTGTSTFSTPSGITKVSVEVQAAGGAGGGFSNDAGCGGGAGGFSTEMVDITGTSTIQVFVGSGGTGGSNADGTAGTWSTFGTNGFYLSSTGGSGGIHGTPCLGAAGGTGSGGDLNFTGSSGGSADTVTNSFVGGYGGASRLGASIAGGIATTGGNGLNYGGGGAGGAASAGSGAGGSGAQGIVIVRW